MPQNGKLHALALAMLVTVWCSITFAATVANEAGDTSAGSLRGIVGSANANGSIDFSPAVASIIPDGTATTAASNLTLTGRDNGFAVALDSLLSFYGIDTMTNTLTVGEGGIDLSGLDPALASLGRPGVVIDGQLASRLLEFTATSPSETILTGLALQNVTQEYIQPDNDKSDNSNANNESADAGVLTGNPITAGGALRIVGAGDLASLAFLNNTLSITGGIAKGGQSSGTFGYADATAPANAYGGAAYIGGAGEITSTLFRGNTVAAQGGTAVGGTATSTVNGYNSSARTESNATAHGGGAYISGAGEITLSIFQGNKAVSTGGTATGGNATATNGSADGYGNTNAYAYGGGAYIGGVGNITSSLFQGNSATATGGLATGSANVFVTGNAFSSNTYGNASIQVYGGGTYIFGIGNITSSIFEGNAVSGTGGTGISGDSTATNSNASSSAYVNAYGGGAYIGGAGNITSSLFQANTATSTGGTTTGGAGTNNGVNGFANSNANTYGGGVYVNNIGEIASSFFLNNAVTATGGAATAGVAGGQAHATAVAYANGGGAHIANQGEITSSIFQGNMTTATGGAATGAAGNATWRAYGNASAFSNGAGAYILYGDIASSVFQGNIATATGGSVATGGTATGATWANADAYAFGGGAFFWTGAESSIEDTSFIGNSVVATAEGVVTQGGVVTAPVAEARGGAVFVNTSTSNASDLALTATAGNSVVIAGNTANGEASGIHFGRAGSGGIPLTVGADTGYFSESEKANFTVTAAGDILMADPLTVEMYSPTSGKAAFAMDIAPGAGTFRWGGKNVLDANAGSSVTFKNGSSTVLLDDFTLTTSAAIDYRTGSVTDAYARDSATNAGAGNTNALAVVLEGGSTLTFRDSRPADLALFDFTNATSGAFTVNSGAKIGMEMSRRLLSFNESYLIADGIAGSEQTAAYNNLALGEFVSALDITQDHQLWAVVDYKSPYQSTIDKWRNLSNAAPYLEGILTDATVTDGQFAAVTANLESVLPDHALNSSVASVARLRWVAAQALGLGMRPIPDESDVGTASVQGYASLRGSGPRARYRLWGGYIGNTDRVDSHDRYFGYKEHTSGFLTGLSRDFAGGSVGAYFAYTGSVLRMRSGNNGRVEADGYHGSLMGSIRPLPRLTLTVDAGVGFYDNDSRRFDGVDRVSGDFNQTLWTGGLGSQYDFIFGRGRFAPFAAIRYIHSDQDGFTEKGGLTSVRVGEIDGDSLQTELGARLSGDYRFACGRGTVSPYGSVSWRHEFADRDFSTSGVFMRGSHPSFGLRSVQRDRDVLGFGAGVDVRYELSGGDRWIGANIGYDAGIGDNGLSQSLTAAVSFGF